MHLMCIEAEKLYEKDPKLKKDDVKILQDWLKKQPHLPPVEESQIILFLHAAYYRIETAKIILDAYFTRRTLYPEIFHCPSEDIIRKGLSFAFKKVLPKKTPEGNSIFMTKLLDFKVENFDYIQDILMVNLVSVLDLHKIGFSEGVINVIDLKGGTLGHMAKVNFQAMRHQFEFVQEGLPVRLKETHIVNTVPFMDKIMVILKSILKSELFNTIHLHSSIDTLYKYVPKECLPEDYGGDLPSCQILNEESSRNIFENLEFFKWHDSQRVDETKRIEKSKIVNANFGVDGTFKKLEID